MSTSTTRRSVALPNNLFRSLIADQRRKERTMMIRIEVSTFLKEVQAVAYRSFSRGGSFLRHVSARSPGARGTAKKSPSHHIHQRLNTTINVPRPPATVRLLVRLKQYRTASFVQRNSGWSKRLVANLVARSSSHRLVTGGRPPNSSEENQDSASTSSSSSSLSINSSQSSSSSLSWLEQAQSLPNLITISRIASAPILGYCIATEQTQYALLLCGFAGLSDWLDGHIARRYNLATKLGSYLDPLGTFQLRNFSWLDSF
jgi:hypothetical protein